MRITTDKQAVQVAAKLVGDWNKEYVIGLYLNANMEMITGEIISIGSLNESVVHPREVYKPAFSHSAASVILLHNHPSGDLTPSKMDKAVTKRLKEAGILLEIVLQAHIIFALSGKFKAIS